MIASSTFLAVIVTIAVLIAGLTPFLLIALWMNDRRKGRLW